MTEKILHVKWGDFQKNFSETFQITEKYMCDVTLVCEGNHAIDVHKIILSAASQIFNDLLLESRMDHPVIYLSEITLEIMSQIVEFIYHGQINVYQKSLDKFYEIGKSLKLNGLNGSHSQFIENELENQREDHDDMEGVVSQNNCVMLYENEATVKAKSEQVKKDLLDWDIKQVPIIPKTEDSKASLPQINFGKDITNIYGLKEAIHSSIIKSGENFLCKICPKSSVNIWKAKSHAQMHVKSQIIPGSHSCLMCGKIFTTSKRLETHKIKKHKKLNKGRYQVIINNEVKEDNINQKLRTMVQKINGSWSCKICGKPGRDQSNSILHAEIHIKGVSRKCNTCGKLFATLSCLRSHNTLVHSTNDSFKCNQCEYVASRSNLKSHKESVHVGLKYQCPYCQIKCSTKGNMNKHVRTSHPYSSV